MNKRLTYMSLIAIIIAVMVTGCVDDGLVQNNTAPSADRRISFVQKVGNMTRSTSMAQDADHYEFGVFAIKSNALTDYDAATNGVMSNYLVAYTNGTAEGVNNWYKDVKANATTWGNAASGNLTDAATGISSWFYEGITDANHATYTTPETNQIIKYWDKSKSYHHFFAYMPYTKKASAETTYNADQIAFAYDEDTKHAKFVYSNLSSFYTSPVDGKQVATAAAKNNGSDKSYDNNAEIINDNEALYAYKAMSKAQYEEDVPLEFKHINAKVNIAFYEVIDGYKVQIIDIIPPSTPGPAGTLTAAPGVQFSPSSDIQAQQPMTILQTTDLPTYYEAANITASHIENGTATLSLTGSAVTKNLVFAATNATGAPLPESGETQYIGEDRTHKTASATTLYVLPNYDGANYITAADTHEYATNGVTATGGGTTANVADKTGYTLHVTYKLLPEDGTSATIVYDARVHIDAEYCRWQAGKAYTYIFKITTMSNGTTDPTAVDPAKDTEPWVDERDPRVPDEPALIPIIFDGVVVTDYEEAEVPVEKSDPPSP